MIVQCDRCGVGNLVTRENWKCKKCSTKYITPLPKPKPKSKAKDIGNINTYHKESRKKMVEPEEINDYEENYKEDNKITEEK